MAKKLPVDEIQVIPINAEKTIIPLVEQLNGLIDRYNAIYGLYSKFAFTNGNESDYCKRLKRVLDNIEKAIEALCLQICEPKFLIKTNDKVT